MCENAHQLTRLDFYALKQCKRVLVKSQMSVRPSVKRVDCDKTTKVLPRLLYRMKERLS